jgi:hypothetical protein
MTTEKQKWKNMFTSPLIMTLVIIWVIISYLLWRTWKDGAPWPFGMAMPF